VPFGIIWSPRKALYGLNKVGAEESDNGAGKLSGTEYCKMVGYYGGWYINRWADVEAFHARRRRLGGIGLGSPVTMRG